VCCSIFMVENSIFGSQLMPFSVHVTVALSKFIYTAATLPNVYLNTSDSALFLNIHLLCVTFKNHFYHLSQPCDPL